MSATVDRDQGTWDELNAEEAACCGGALGRIQSLTRGTEEFIEKQPLRAVMIALAIGFVAGVITLRR